MNWSDWVNATQFTHIPKTEYERFITFWCLVHVVKSHRIFFCNLQCLRLMFLDKIKEIIKLIAYEKDNIYSWA
jgi:hypothetical protein